MKSLFAIDTNLIVYAHNKDSRFSDQAAAFMTKVMNERDSEGRLKVCLPSQVIVEFIHVMTWARVGRPLSLAEATGVVQDYVDSEILVVHPLETQTASFLELLEGVESRKKLFDVALAATLRDNEIAGLYTVNVDHFKAFDFLQVVNPLRPPSQE